jgi:hypothetical protein
MAPRPYTVSLLPNAGLGNKLLVWARGLVHAHQTNTLHRALFWSRPSRFILAKSRTSLYGKFIRDNPISEIAFLSRFYNEIRSGVVEPNIGVPSGAKWSIFNQVPHWSDYFLGIRDHRDLIQFELSKLVRGENQSAISNTIAIHMRRGDFKDHDPKLDFRAQGNTRTPICYFEKVMASIKRDYPDFLINVYTDEVDSEVLQFCQKWSARVASTYNPASDLLQMSASRILVLSASSTFSLWSAFLSRGVIVHHPDHFHQPVRSAAHNALELVAHDGELPIGWSEYLRAQLDRE